MVMSLVILAKARQCNCWGQTECECQEFECPVNNSLIFAVAALEAHFPSVGFLSPSLLSAVCVCSSEVIMHVKVSLFLVQV